MSDVLYAEEGAVAVITLNRPDALNAFDRAMRMGFIEAMGRAETSHTVRAVVVCGAGRGFSSGADLKEGLPKEGVRAMVESEYNRAILAITNLPKPVIAAVHGFVTGIGLSYALACDLVVLSEQAFMQVPFSKIGLIPDGGLSWQLARRVGHQLGFELAMTGDRVPAARCRELGLANRLVAETEVLMEAKAWAAQLATQPPLAMAATKRALRAAGAASLEDILRLEAQLQQDCTSSADFKEGIAAFFEKRAAHFTGK